MPSNFPGGVSGKGQPTDDFSSQYKSTATTGTQTKNNTIAGTDVDDIGKGFYNKNTEVTGVNNAGRYNLELAAKLPVSIVTGKPMEIVVSEEGAISMVNSITSEEQLKNLANFVTFNNSTPTDAENTINPVGKTDGVLGNGWQIQGGSTFNVVTDDKGNITALEIVSNKTLRTTSGGERVKTTPGATTEKGEWQSELKPGESPTWFSDIPDVPLDVVERKVEQLLQNPIIDKFLRWISKCN